MRRAPSLNSRTSRSVHIAERVRELMHSASGRYPTTEDLADQLHMSVRTLKRKLAEQGSGFRQLLNEAKRFDAVELLCEQHLSIEQIALELGYADPANFTRA